MTFDTKVTEKFREIVRQRMATYTLDMMTPVFRAFSDGYGELAGTGNFITLGSRSYLLTNEHVITTPTNITNPLDPAEFFEPVYSAESGTPPIPFSPSFHFKKQPFDFALARIAKRSLSSSSKRGLENRCFSGAFEEVEGEIYFLHGYPDATATGSFNLKESKVKTFPFCTFIKDLPDEFDPKKHFALDYNKGIKRKDLEGDDYNLPEPHGLSGSLVWSTNVIKNNLEKWDEDEARVVGIIRKDDFQDDQLIATRIEPLIEFLLEARRREAAYFRWTSRGAPHGDALSDWLWAENEIRDLDADETCQVL